MKTKSTRTEPTPQPTQPQVQANCATDLWPEDSLYYRGALREVVDMSLAQARRLNQQTIEAPPGKPAPDITIPLERVTRIIRYTIGLARKVAEPLPAAPTASTSHEHTKTRDHIIREVEDVILDHFKGRAFKNFRDDLFCYLEKPDFERMIGKRPIPELITELARHLGLAGLHGPEPLRYHTDEALEEIEERANRPRPPREPPPWPEPSPKKPVQASRSFLQKRTKKPPPDF